MELNGLKSNGFLSLGDGIFQNTEVFNAGPLQRKVDILFVDDNSASMDALQNSLGSRFPSFSAAVNGLDWQIGITTTDCSTGPFGICGSLLSLTGLGDYILTPASPNFTQVFNNSIVRPETIGCIARGDCPSGISEPLKATMNALNKRASNNARFFRADAALAVIMLTNADEMNDGAAGATTAQQVVNHFRGIYGTTKEFKAYAIDIVPGDASCLASAGAASAGQVFYGVGPSQLATLTGGFSRSLCAADFSPLLQQIGGDLQAQPNVITLAFKPDDGIVELVTIPDAGIGWTLNEKTITFDRALPPNTEIRVTYKFKN